MGPLLQEYGGLGYGLLAFIVCFFVYYLFIRIYLLISLWWKLLLDNMQDFLCTPSQTSLSLILLFIL